MTQVLIIEDDDALRIELVELFDTLGAKVSDARDGAAARRACDDARFDLILCDYKLEAENGLDVIRGISAGGRMPAADIYLMTGHIDLTKAARDEIAVSTRGLLMKPIGADHLRRVFDQASSRSC